MNDRCDRFAFDQLNQGCGCSLGSQIELNQLGSADSAAKSRGKVVDDRDSVTLFLQESNHVRADIAGSTGDENAHLPRLSALWPFSKPQSAV